MESKTIKIVVWHVLVLILALWMWGTGGNIHFNEITGIDVNLPSLIAFLLLISLIIIGYLLFRNREEPLAAGTGFRSHFSVHQLWPLTISLMVGLLFLFQFGFNWLNLIGVGLFIAFNYEAYSRAGRELNERIKINIARFLQHSLMPVILGIFIMISFTAYESPFADQIKSSGRLPSQTKVFFEQVVDKTFGSKINASNPQEKQRVMNEIVTQTYNDINAFLKPYFQYAPPALAFALFLILWGLSWFFVLLGSGVGVFVFWLLKKTKVVSIGSRDIKAESLNV